MLAFNRELDSETAEENRKNIYRRQFAAPGYLGGGALKILTAKKKSLRLLEVTSSPLEPVVKVDHGRLSGADS